MTLRPRRDPRLLTDIETEIRGARRHDGRARDLSVGGLRVRLPDSHVVVGERLGVTLRVVGLVAMAFAAEVRWVRRHEIGLGCDAGLEFDHTPDSRRLLQQLLWELQSGNVPEVERRTRTRPKGLTG